MAVQIVGRQTPSLRPWKIVIRMDKALAGNNRFIFLIQLQGYLGQCNYFIVIILSFSSLDAVQIFEFRITREIASQLGY